MKVNERIYTPCFCTVTVEKIFESRKEARQEGYTEPTYYNEPMAEEVTESIGSTDATTTITAEEYTKVEANETGAWAGRIVIDGGMYRICMTSAAISLVSDGNNKYHGIIKIHANDGLSGYLEGDITASGKVGLSKEATVRGNITAAAIGVAVGAKLEGNLSIR